MPRIKHLRKIQVDAFFRHGARRGARPGPLDHLRPARLERPAKGYKWLTAAAGAAAIILGVDYLETRPAAAVMPPPVEFKGMTLDRPFDQAEGALRIKFLGRRNRLCDATIERLIERPSDGMVVWREHLYGIHLAISNEFQIRRTVVKLPVLERGNYEFSDFVRSDCGPGDTAYASVGDPIKFTIN